MFAWCLWLLGSWSVTLWIDSTVPAVRWMIFAAMIGLMVIWPVLRLSHDTLGSQARVPERAFESVTSGQIMADWLSMMLVFQAVLWPLRISSNWSLEQCGWLDAAVASWSLLIGAVVAFGCASVSGARRALAMLLCLLLFLGEPLVMALVNYSAARRAGVIWPMRLSPIEAIWTLTAEPSAWMLGAWRERILAVALAAAAAWVWVIFSTRNVRPPAAS